MQGWNDGWQAPDADWVRRTASDQLSSYFDPHHAPPCSCFGLSELHAQSFSIIIHALSFILEGRPTVGHDGEQGWLEGSTRTEYLVRCMSLAHDWWVKRFGTPMRREEDREEEREDWRIGREGCVGALGLAAEPHESRLCIT